MEVFGAYFAKIRKIRQDTVHIYHITTHLFCQYAVGDGPVRTWCSPSQYSWHMDYEILMDVSLYLTSDQLRRFGVISDDIVFDVDKVIMT